jgi:hypothetical protein
MTMPDVPPEAGTPAREEIIERLAAAFGPHKSYDPETRTYVPDGDDAEGSTTISFLAADGHMSLRSLTYGEIADALTRGDQ